MKTMKRLLALLLTVMLGLGFPLRAFATTLEDAAEETVINEVALLEDETINESTEPVGESETVSEGAEPAGESEAVDEDAEPVENGATVSEGAEPVENGATVSEDAEPAKNGATVSKDAEPARESEAVDEDAEPVENGATVGEDAEPAENGATVNEDAEPVGESEAVDEDAEKINSPTLAIPLFDFTLDPYGLVEATNAARYGGGCVEPGARLIFHNRSGEYDFSSKSDRITFTNNSAYPLQITLTATLSNMREVQIADLEVPIQRSKPAVYLALTDDKNHESPVSRYKTASIVYELPASSAPDEISAYSFGLAGTCNSDGDWIDVDVNATVTVAWSVEPIFPESVDSSSVSFNTLYELKIPDRGTETETAEEKTDMKNPEALEDDNSDGETAENQEAVLPKDPQESNEANNANEESFVSKEPLIDDVTIPDSDNPLQSTDEHNDNSGDGHGGSDGDEDKNWNGVIPSGDAAEPVGEGADSLTGTEKPLLDNPTFAGSANSISGSVSPDANNAEPFDDTQTVNDTEPPGVAEALEYAEPSEDTQPDTQPVENAELSGDTEPAQDTEPSDVEKPVESVAESLQA